MKIILPRELFSGDVFSCALPSLVLKMWFFSSFLLPWEQPFLSSCRIPALISMGDESLDFCFCMDIKSWASKRLKPNCGSDVASPDHGGVSHYCPLGSDNSIVPSPLQFFFRDSSLVFTLFFKIIKFKIIFRIIFSQNLQCLWQETFHVSCVYHVLGPREILLYSFYLEWSSVSWVFFFSFNVYVLFILGSCFPHPTPSARNNHSLLWTILHYLISVLWHSRFPFNNSYWITYSFEEKNTYPQPNT